MPGDKPDGDFNSLRVIGKNGFSTAENEVKIEFLNIFSQIINLVQIVSPEGASIPPGHRTVINQTAMERSKKYVVYDGADQVNIILIIINQ